MANNKINIVLVACMLLSANLFAQTSVRFGIKCGTIYYTVKSSINIQGFPPLKISAEGKSSFDNYGEKIASRYSETSDPGDVILRTTKHYISLKTPDCYCLVNADTNEKIDQEDLSSTTKEILSKNSITDYDNLSDSESEMFTSQFIGTTVFLGKNCKKYKVKEKVSLYGSEDILVVWNNIVLQRTTKSAGFQYEYKVVKIEEDLPDPSLFEMPAEFTAYR